MSLLVWIKHYWCSRPPLWGARVILRSLIILCVGAAPFIASEMLLRVESPPVLLSYSLIAAALIAHLGFLLGVLHLTWEMYATLNRRGPR